MTDISQIEAFQDTERERKKVLFNQMGDYGVSSSCYLIYELKIDMKYLSHAADRNHA